jgi:hypothetical protein
MIVRHRPDFTKLTANRQRKKRRDMRRRRIRRVAIAALSCCVVFPILAWVVAQQLSLF